MGASVSVRTKPGHKQMYGARPFHSLLTAKYDAAGSPVASFNQGPVVMEAGAAGVGVVVKEGGGGSGFELE